MQIKEEGKSASDVTLITYNDSHKRLNLLQARELSVEGSELLGRDVAILTHLDSPQEEFDKLIVENQSSMSTAAPILSLCLKKSLPRMQSNAMTLRMLRLQANLGGKKLASSARLEILRRTSLSLAVFSFTFLGCAFWITAGRNAKQSYFTMLMLALTVLATYLAGKEFKSYPILAIFIFLLPHPLIWIASIYRLNRVSKGTSA
jgi:lipopolysaccharide export system permease protein